MRCVIGGDAEVLKEIQGVRNGGVYGRRAKSSTREI